MVMTLPLSVLDDTSTDDKLIHVACPKCDYKFSICGVPRWDPKSLPPGSANCEECIELRKVRDHR